MTTLVHRRSPPETSRTPLVVPPSGGKRGAFPRWSTTAVARWAAVIVGCLIFLTPAIAILLTALQPESSIAQRGPAAVPNQLTLSNFSSAWSTGELGHYYINSLLITLCRVPLAILVSSLAAYPLAKIRFRGRKVLLVLLVVGLGVPQVILLYPLLQITRHLPLSSTVWVLLLPYVATGIPFEILVMRGAFMGVSREYLEAARIDGARERYVWARICIPMVKPAIFALALLDFVWTWNEFVIAYVLLSNQSSQTLPVGILNLEGLFSTNYAQLAAGVVLCTIPMVLFFFVARKYLTRGIAVGGVKG